MKLIETPQLPNAPESAYDRRLGQVLYRLLADVARKVNAMAAGQVLGLDGGATSVPTAGTWAQGDTVRNPNPTVQGTAGAQYVITGWLCVAGGTPGTWVQTRVLTGN